jgi:hypothetical protein
VSDHELDPVLQEYLDFLNVSSVVRNRIGEISRFYAEILPGASPERVFISETVGADGQRVYENLWFFYENVWAEAHNFLLDDNFDVTALTAVGLAVVERKDFTPGKATTKSRLQVRCSFQGEISGTFKASGENCDRLQAILVEAVVPRVVATGGTS